MNDTKDIEATDTDLSRPTKRAVTSNGLNLTDHLEAIHGEQNVRSSTGGVVVKGA